MDIYGTLLQAASGNYPVRRALLGFNWTLIETAGIGISYSPLSLSRTLSWPGTLAGSQSTQLCDWLTHWEPGEAAIGLACMNSIINADSALLRNAVALQLPVPGHLQVFAHFSSQVRGKRIVVIGRYPGLDRLWADVNYQCIERQPQPGDLPDVAAEYVLEHADWVFITASSLANKTLPRLLALSRNASVVLMGPSLPWWQGWRDAGVHYLAGVRVNDAETVWRICAEGGGTRLFDEAVQYCLLPLI